MIPSQLESNLTLYYPGEAFAFCNWVKDDLNYVHWVVQSRARVVVVTTDPYDHLSICEQNEVATPPDTVTLRSSLRGWKPEGALGGLIFDTFPERTNHRQLWAITPKFLWDREHILLDGHELDPLLEFYGFKPVAESVYEFWNEDAPQVGTYLLEEKGAKPCRLHSAGDSLVQLK